VSYAAIQQLRALAEARPENREIRLFGTRSGSAARSIPELENLCPAPVILPRLGGVKTWAWTRWNGPAIEHFVGPCDIAHGLFHLLPAARRAKRVVTIHDLSFLRYPQYHTPDTVATHTRLVRHAVRYADAIVTVSESTRKEVIELLQASPDRVHTVPNGVDSTEFDQRPDGVRFARLQRELHLGDRFAVHLGTIEPRKNIVRLLEAFHTVRPTLGAGAQLLLIGRRGWLSEPIFDRIEHLSLGGAVIHAGHLDRADAAELLRRARLCVYPSMYEGFGLPVLEAMAAGTPVLTSNVSSLPEVAGDAAWLVDPFDTATLSEGLARVFTDDAVRDRLREAGRRQAARYSWNASAEALWALYDRLGL
jgi:glycosyltransferase involved in cell wall biosynthesis